MIDWANPTVART